MDVKGADEATRLFEQWQSILAKVRMTPQIVMTESTRLASAKTVMKERGPLKDRLAKTDAEAEINAAVESVRAGLPTATGDTPAEDEALTDSIIDKLVDDLIEKTILKGL